MNPRTKVICLFTLLATGLGFWIYCQTGTAQINPSTASIAFCNPNKVLQAYTKVISMRADLISERDRIKQKVMDAQKDIRARTEELAVSGFSPESQEHIRMRKDLLERSVRNEVFVKVSENDLRFRDKRIKDVFVQDMYAAVRKVARKKGLLMVFPQVLYGHESLDITAEVIEQLNTDYELRG